MTIAQMKREMKKHKLSQGDVAEMLGITQPTVSNILSGEHELSARNMEAFVRGLARCEAVTRAESYGASEIKCKRDPEHPQRMTVRAYVAHLDMCAVCMTRAFLSSADENA